MGESKISFGDKIFLYGQHLQYLEFLDEAQYNSVLGYMTVGGYFVYPVETDTPNASIPGYVVDAGFTTSLAPATPFDRMDMIEVTDCLALNSPQPSGTKVWMPTTL